jgi:D-aminopeptidase
MTKPRARDLGLPFPGTPGQHNAITDIQGVCVGETTLISGDGPLVPGKGPVRTGVTAILPFGHDKTPRPISAGFHALNGNGEMTGVHWVNDAGYFVGPICITNTHAIGAVHHGAVQWMIEHYGADWHTHHLWAMPVIAETYDGVLNDINGLHVKPEHAVAALNSAKGGPVAEGNTGGGTGMICYEFKGGTGTASRRITIDGSTYHMAALVQANHGTRDWLTILGVPVGQHLTKDVIWSGGKEQGSIIVILATDMPMLPHQLRRLAKRAAIGIGRNGTPGGNNSGDIFLAFSTANKTTLPPFSPVHLSMRYLNDEAFDGIYEAAVHAVEEAVVNALIAAEDMTTLRPAGKTVRAMPHAPLMAVMKQYGRFAGNFA